MSEKLRKGRNTLLTDNKNNNYLSKKLVGEYEDKKRRINNIIAWNNLLPIDKINSPQLFNIDLNNFIVKHKYINHTTSLDDVLNDDLINNKELFYESMFIISKIHSINSKHIDIKANINIKNNSPLEIMDIKEYKDCSGGELELFSMLQHDEQLLKQLSMDYGHEIAPIHGDIRLDQFLIDNFQKLWIIDFEEFSYGDITKDIAGLIGSLIFNTLLNVFSTSVPDLFKEEDINKDFLNRGSKELDKLMPILNNSINIYQQSRNIKINLKTLSVSVGWFLLERVISRSKLTFRLSEIDKAIAGIGRQAIVYPETFISLLTDAKGDI